MKRLFVLAALCAALVPAFAQSTAETQSLSRAETAISNVGSPTINNNSAPVTDATIRQHGLPVSSAASTFVNGPAGDTCAKPGDAISGQAATFGFSATKGGGESAQCDDRADPRSMKETGEDAVAITMRHCQSPRKAEAYEDAADLRDAVVARMPEAVRMVQPVSFRCPDRLRPTWALEREGKKANTALNGGQSAPATVTAANTQDPFIRERLQRTGR